MVSLKIKNGTKVEVEKGYVDMSGPAVCLWEVVGPKREKDLVASYHLNPGENVRRTAEGEYLVEF